MHVRMVLGWLHQEQLLLKLLLVHGQEHHQGHHHQEHHQEHDQEHHQEHHHRQEYRILEDYYLDSLAYFPPLPSETGTRRLALALVD